MGAWGIEIFDNDDALDIIEEYKILLGYKVSPIEAYEKIKECFYNDYQNACEEDIYWLSIALFQWKNGILMDEVKYNALKCIDNGKYLETWKECGENIYNKRKAVLNNLKNKLLYEINPPKKRFSKCPMVYRRKTPYEVGDLLACHIIRETSPYTDIYPGKQLDATEIMLRNQYVLFRVVEVSKTPVTSLMPELDYTSSAIVMMYDWHGYDIPSANVISKLTFTPIVNVYEEERKK